MSNIQYHINRTKKQLANDGKYYPCMANVQFVFRCDDRSRRIHIITKDEEYFKKRFGMKDSYSGLVLIGTNDNNGSWGRYFNLYYNALIIMLEQSLNNPRPIVRELDISGSNSLSYQHNPKDPNDNLDRILYRGNVIRSIMLEGDNKEGTGALEEYVNMVKKSWNGTNCAYNIFLYDQVLTFDTYPAY